MNEEKQRMTKSAIEKREVERRFRDIGKLLTYSTAEGGLSSEEIQARVDMAIAIAGGLTLQQAVMNKAKDELKL